MTDFSYEIIYIASEIVDVVFKLGILTILYQAIEHLNWRD